MEHNNLRRVLEEFGRDFVNLVQDKIIEADGIATGNMLNTLDFDVVQENGHLTVYLLHTDYFQYYDKGSSPHFPPREPIMRWIQDKPVYPTADDNGRLPTVEQLAFLIARKISEDGTEGRDVFETAKAQLIPMYEEKIAEAVRDDFVEEYLNGGNINEWNLLKI